VTSANIKNLQISYQKASYNANPFKKIVSIFCIYQALSDFYLLSLALKKYVKINGMSGTRKKKKRRLGRSWHIRFGEIYPTASGPPPPGLWYYLPI